MDRALRKTVEELLRYFPAVAILGPRQCGKTTLALELGQSWSSPTDYLDLENNTDLVKLEDAASFLAPLQDHLVIIDEVQQRPALFPQIRGLIDEGRRSGITSGRFLFLGSASYELLKQSGESLAGRIAYLELTPFLTSEVEKSDFDALWLRGGFPDSFLAPTDSLSTEWRRNFIDTYLTRDLSQQGAIGSLPAMRNLMQMTAHLHGQVLNISQLVESHEFNRRQITQYLDLFEQTFVIRRLQPYFKNVGKRLVKRPKVYIRDSGLLHQLLNISDIQMLHGHPSKGASWEGFVIEQVIAMLPDWHPYFYRTSHGAEIDLIMMNGTTLLAFEIKASGAPSLTRGFHSAREDIEATRSFVISRADGTWQGGKNVTYTDLESLRSILSEFR